MVAVQSEVRVKGHVTCIGSQSYNKGTTSTSGAWGHQESPLCCSKCQGQPLMVTEAGEQAGQEGLTENPPILSLDDKGVR